jgi:transcriptional regulator with XRE-family HTH domain
MVLKELINLKGVKQKWLAEKVGVSEVSLSNWCSGKSIPTKKHLQKISEVLDVSAKSISF